MLTCRHCSRSFSTGANGLKYHMKWCTGASQPGDSHKGTSEEEPEPLSDAERRNSDSGSEGGSLIGGKRVGPGLRIEPPTSSMGVGAVIERVRSEEAVNASYMASPAQIGLVIGNEHSLLDDDDVDAPEGEMMHRWTVYVRNPKGIESHPKIANVSFELHPDFQPSMVTVREAPFELTREGWGAFDVGVEIKLEDGTSQRHKWTLDFNGKGSERRITSGVGDNTGERGHKRGRGFDLEGAYGADQEEMTPSKRRRGSVPERYRAGSLGAADEFMLDKLVAADAMTHMTYKEEAKSPAVKGMCKRCQEPALNGNYGFCATHRDISDKRKAAQSPSSVPHSPAGLTEHSTIQAPVMSPFEHFMALGARQAERA